MENTKYNFTEQMVIITKACTSLIERDPANADDVKSIMDAVTAMGFAHADVLVDLLKLQIGNLNK